MKNKISFIVLFVLTILVVVIAIFMPFNSQLKNIDFKIEDNNNNYQYEVGESLNFIINDTVAVEDRVLKWYFGNGDSIISNKKFTYHYNEAGRYLITLDIDDKHTVSRYIKVISFIEKSSMDSIPTVHGPHEAYVGEELVFSSDGEGVNTWYWEFGETGTVDAYDQQVVYTYSIPGDYIIQLQTNTLKYPIYSRIKILPRFEKIEEMEAVDSLVLAQEDVRDKLQSIADASVSNEHIFYDNIAYLKTHYLCNNVEKVVVTINGSKYNDLYSYCQGLHFLEGGGGKKLKIDQVKLDTFKCVTRIDVIQSPLPSSSD
ncbi:MAG: hypothetical protein N4A37_00925 [Prolixibacteraceae bacterium]|jgi:hypothetical protein|nr:hypothetical protein [Prolixibacteraceae bacterium]